MPLLMSAFTPKANIGPQSLHVRFGSKADIDVHMRMSALPPKRTLAPRKPMSALCQ